ncbi:E3 ubiquitin-protein ligase TRIM7-like isoform X1 [Pygocentrus nattereri]|uniref:B30.2/SPRY domain-containing protein n=1 Tax=Pygocentrus nattereri TaxID=42514 RepID=A0AAR2LA84_PYGNA|nr:E3 ubiquitin-protein ligase TRIM7-like isoform X1 [Pygocentrus nattereri]
MSSQKQEDNITGACYSVGSLLNPHKAEIKTACNSQPFLKPKLGIMKLKDKLLKKFHGQIKKQFNNDTEQIDFSMEVSKCILRELAAELDRLVSLRELLIQSEVSDDKIHQEESQTLVLQWADELSSQQQKRKQETTQMLTELKTTEDHEDSQNLDKEQRLQDAKMILSDWTWKLKSKETVKLGEECKAVLQDLCKQWKKGKLVNILPIMDFIIRILLQENKTEESMLKQWFKSEKVFRKAGGLYVPTPVWNCITRHPAEVILDPQTANPNLMLDKDGRSVRTKTHEESITNPWNDYQRKHSKYDGWMCVQAKKGYTTGSYYWEVDVNGKYDWRIGVVKESAPRLGYVNMNTKAGYWTLRLQLGSLMALTDPVTKLNYIALSKIGVNLDIEEGRVSFYDSEKRRHIYTFKTHFMKSERIYPVFGTVETGRALRII